MELRSSNAGTPRDGVIRVGTVRTATGTEIKRPAVKLCALPTEDDTILVENYIFNGGGDVRAATPIDTHT